MCGGTHVLRWLDGPPSGDRHARCDHVQELPAESLLPEEDQDLRWVTAILDNALRRLVNQSHRAGKKNLPALFFFCKRIFGKENKTHLSYFQYSTYNFDIVSNRL